MFEKAFFKNVDIEALGKSVQQFEEAHGCKCKIFAAKKDGNTYFKVIRVS